jgi:hypothetical protein
MRGVDLEVVPGIAKGDLVGLCRAGVNRAMQRGAKMIARTDLSGVVNRDWVA